jgi:hypothetical protein
VLLKGKKTSPPQGFAEDYIAGPREVLPLSRAIPGDLEDYDPEEPGFGPAKITCDDRAELEKRLLGYNGRALVVAPPWAEPLAIKYGGVLARNRIYSRCA